MIFATAGASHYAPIRNLSTTHKHCTTNTDLCSTTKDTYETYCNLPTAIDPFEVPWKTSSTPDSLSSTAIHLFRPHDNSWAAVQPYKTHGNLPADQRQTLRPDANLWPTNAEPDQIRHQSWLDHYEPFVYSLSGAILIIRKMG